VTRTQAMASEYSVRDELESVTLVDAENNAIGSCGKIAAHRDGNLHRAFSILISNPDGELLLQRRAAHKYHFASRWSNTCSAGPIPVAVTRDRASRRFQRHAGGLEKSLASLCRSRSLQNFDIEPWIQLQV